MNRELSDLIDKIVRESTFSLDANVAVTKLIESAKGLQKALEEQRELNKQADDRYKLLDGRYNSLVGELSDVKKARDEAMKRADRNEQAYHDSVRHQAVADAWKSAMMTVFAPNVTRTAVQRSVAVPVTNGGYTNLQSMSEYDTTVVTEGGSA